MVTKKELNGFKQTLITALQKAGYTAYGRVSSSEETFNTYAHLPEKEMVEQYVSDYNLDEINKVYRIIKFIDENSGKNFSLMALCREQGIDYRLFSHAVENLPYVDKTGERRKTQYHWINEEQPSFAAARTIVEHMRDLKSANLNKSLKGKIRKAVAEGISKEEFFKTNKMRKDSTYSAEAYFNYQKVQQRKDTFEDTGSELPEEPGVTEKSYPAPEPEIHSNQAGVNGENYLKEEETTESADIIIDEASLEVENYILRQEIKYLKRINKAKDRLIKALRRKTKNS